MKIFRNVLLPEPAILFFERRQADFKQFIEVESAINDISYMNDLEFLSHFQQRYHKKLLSNS